MILRSIFLPDNRKFFQLFDKVADHLNQMSLHFANAVSDTSKVTDCLGQLDLLEKANDTTTHKIFVELGRNFITPFDREDIHYLASGLDDIADDMLAVVRQIRSHDIDGVEEMVSVGKYNTAIIKLLCEMVYDLKNTRSLNSISHKCTQALTLVWDADNQVEQAVHNLFAGQHDAITIIRKMDHYDKLQQLMSRTSNVIHVIESIIIKYG